MVKDVVDELAGLSRFVGGDSGVLAAVQAAAKLRNFSAKQIIVGQDGADKDVFCLLKGQARAVVYSSEGHEIWLDDFGPGDLFGEMAALTDMHRSADIVAASNVAVAVFAARDFITLMEEFGEFGLAVSRRLVERIRHTTQRMFELSVLSAPGRVYAELLRAAEHGNLEGSEIREIRPVPQITELARRINSTRETVSRTINDLERRGLVIRERGAMTILAPKQLGALTYLE
ncbi:MAG: Crp/Fnr family transcriptional regulator [Sphingomonadales bacterium]|nr:Crp/Fnr family transcriptional regulator [Sphingomonadales bacterium]